jgi:U3 small nucleolar RNA-associated protein 6
VLVLRALQLHPTAPPLFILASAHELDQLSPSSSRSLLQRGLRLNPESIELWTEYLKMELTYIESLRRRWAVLGVDVAADTEGKKGDGETGAPPPDDELDESRRQVMQGAIVLAVMASAVKGPCASHISFSKFSLRIS